MTDTVISIVHGLMIAYKEGCQSAKCKACDTSIINRDNKKGEVHL